MDQIRYKPIISFKSQNNNLPPTFHFSRGSAVSLWYGKHTWNMKAEMWLCHVNSEHEETWGVLWWNYWRRENKFCLFHRTPLFYPTCEWLCWGKSHLWATADGSHSAPLGESTSAGLMGGINISVVLFTLEGQN